jgi:hypothetical protein
LADSADAAGFPAYGTISWAVKKNEYLKCVAILCLQHALLIYHTLTARKRAIWLQQNTKSREFELEIWRMTDCRITLYMQR